MTGVETSFVTEIDWTTQRQEVVLALNTSDLQVPEGSSVDWSNSMCRWAFLSGREQSCDVGTDFPGSHGAERLNMRTFFAVPILAGEATIGTVCGASRRAIDLPAEAVAVVRLIAEAMAFQLGAQVESRTHLERAERAEALALNDFLTGLANRRAFTARLEEELARSGRHGAPIAFLAIDIDRFKAVNDTYGHHGGDKILIAVGDVLSQVGRAGDVPARLGGDEFALLLPDTDAAGAETAAARIVEVFRRATVELGMPCTLSIGISCSATVPRRSLLATADDALYRSKSNGRDRVESSIGCA